MSRQHIASATISATITRKSLPALGPALQPAASNVVKLAKRR